MRFDRYLQQRGIMAVAVDRFDGFEVEVEGPPDWEIVEAHSGLWVWAWPDDPCVRTFCANAVLTMHSVPTALDPGAVFEMLCEEQVHLVPGCRERHREIHCPDDGIGIAGLLSSEFDSEFGCILSLSHSRIFTNGPQTLIAQLTLTALQDSPLDWSHIRLSVVANSATRYTAVAGAGHGGAATVDR